MESGLWAVVRDRLAPYGLVRRLENAIEPGWPDVAYLLRVPARPAVSGWLELKQLPSWPAYPSTPLVVPSLTTEQVRWLTDWTAGGGRADLLLQVARDYLLLDAATVAALHRRELPRAALVRRARVTGARSLPARALVAWLTRPDQAMLRGSKQQSAERRSGIV